MSISVILSITTSASAVEYEYKYTLLLPPGWSSANAQGINDSGAVVGYGYATAADKTNNVPKVFLYSAGVYTELLPPGWSMVGTPIAGIPWSGGIINNSGAVVGVGADGTTAKGFLYSAGVYTDIVPPGWSWSAASGINDSGAVVGYGYATGKSFLYTEGVYTELLPPGWGDAYAYDINDSGAVVGWGHDSTHLTTGFLYSAGV